MGFLEILGLIFIVLKLTKKISWLWIWVLAPFWISFVGYVVLFLCYIGLTIIFR